MMHRPIGFLLRKLVQVGAVVATFAIILLAATGQISGWWLAILPLFLVVTRL